MMGVTILQMGILKFYVNKNYALSPQSKGMVYFTTLIGFSVHNLDIWI